MFIEPQNGTIKLEASEQILQFLSLRQLGRARVVIIDEAQMLNPQTTNALLKAVEEPPENTYFILVVSELSQLLPTLRSRLQVLRFSPLSPQEIAAGEAEPSSDLRGPAEYKVSMIRELTKRALVRAGERAVRL